MNFDDCNGCSLCVIGCQAFKETGNEGVTAQARNFFLKATDDHKLLEENLQHCVQSGYCTTVCPRGVDNSLIFENLMAEGIDSSREVFLDNWKKSANLFGIPLKLEGIGDRFELWENSQYLLQLGCTFVHSHFHRLPTLLKACNRFKLPFYIQEQESCCGRFLKDKGYQKEYEQACHQNEDKLDVVYLDASCAAKESSSFWDYLFQSTSLPSLEGFKLYVSVRWLNGQVDRRAQLLREFVARTGVQVVNQDGLYLAVGGGSSSWRSRIRHPLPMGKVLPPRTLVMEVAEVSSANPWLLEQLVF